MDKLRFKAYALKIDTSTFIFAESLEGGVEIENIREVHFPELKTQLWTCCSLGGTGWDCYIF